MVETKRYTRMKHIVRAYDRSIENQSITASYKEVIMQFQDYSSKIKDSFAKLADTYAQEILGK